MHEHRSESSGNILLTLICAVCIEFSRKDHGRAQLLYRYCRLATNISLLYNKTSCLHRQKQTDLLFVRLLSNHVPFWDGNEDGSISVT